MIKKSKRNIFVTIVALGAATAMLMSACKKKDTDPDGNTSFDQQAMLTNYADNLIIPSYTAVSNSLSSLQASITTFEQNYSTANLEGVRNKWKELYTNWMWANGYNFGPAGEQGIKKRLIEEIATWPIDTMGVQTKMATLDTAFSDFNRDTRGLLAVEYLIFGMQQPASQVVTSFQVDPNRMYYLKALANKVQAQVNEVLTQWQSGYRDAFINNTGTAVGSSVSLLYNEFVRGYEAIKNFKLGIPLGKKAGQTGIEADKVEALFSQHSLPFLKENVTSVEYNWFGKARSGSDAIGWKEYVASATGGEDLINGTQAQQANIAQALTAVNQSLSLYDQINTSSSSLDNLYTELQKQTRFYKSDMSSLLGIAITFTDADGD